MRITMDEARLIEELGKGTHLFTIVRTVLKKHSRYSVEKMLMELKQKGVLVSQAAVNPVKVFKQVVLILIELEEIRGSKDSWDKRWGLGKTIKIIQENFPKISVILGSTVEGEYDFVLLLGVEDSEECKQFLSKLSELRVSKNVSVLPIAASGEFYFNPVAFPAK